MRPIIPKLFRIILRRKAFLVTSLSFIVFIIMGMSSAPRNAALVVSLEEQTRAQVNQALANIKSSYESENLPEFMNLLDNDYEDRLGFQSSLQDYFISHKNLEILVITDTVLNNKDKISVRLHWFKKSFTNDGVLSKSQGSSQFAFNKTAEGLKLLYLRGDNPFF